METKENQAMLLNYNILETWKYHLSYKVIKTSKESLIGLEQDEISFQLLFTKI